MHPKCRSMSLLRRILVLLIGLAALPSAAQENVTFKADDGLDVTAEVYPAATTDAPWIVVAHQAGSSRGEYRDIAPRLQRLGYHVLALDQRSGNSFADVANQTAARAAAASLPINYLDAVPDIVAGLMYANNRTSSAVLLWGSSYSAALALVLAAERADLIDGTLAFSPGEYLSKISVAKAAATIAVPVFITSAAAETDQWSAIFEAIDGTQKTAFRPERGGVHGSSALIPARNPNAEHYWQAVEAFLASHFST